MRRALVGLLILLAPAVLAQETPASPASFLVYRPSPDPLGDPLATPQAPPPFDAARLPALRVDRIAVASAAPENDPSSAPAHYREFLRLTQAAEAEGAPVALTLRGEVVPGALRITTAAVPQGGAPTAVTLELVVFEHGVPVGGRAEPYVARFTLAPVELAAPGDSTQEVRLDPSWNVDRLGVVAIARETDGRVLQSATWLPRQDAPTVQSAKAPLVELVTASWCDPCRPAEEAFLLLATQRGAAGPLAHETRESYLRAPTGWLWAGLALGAVAAIALVGRRDA